MTTIAEAPANRLAPVPSLDTFPVGEATILDAAGVPVVTIPDVWGSGELDHQQDYEDMVDVFSWPDLDEFPDGDFSYPG
jgi:hypothetical protein